MVIFLNGSINSGKTTVGKILCKKIPNTAHIEIDKLGDFIDWMDLEDVIAINLENAVSLIRNFSTKGFNVVATYPLSQRNYDYLIGNLKDIKTKIHTFTLSPKLEVAVSNRGERKLDNWERERIKYHYKIRINNPPFGVIVDNGQQTPEETAQFIFNYINKS